MATTNQVIIIVVISVIVIGLAFAYAYWQFQEDARSYLDGVNTNPSNRNLNSPIDN